MIVVDASVAVGLVVDSTPFYSQAIRARLASDARPLRAPHPIDIEVASVLRRYAPKGALSPALAAGALDDLLQFPIHRYPHTPLLRRILELRDDATSYDAAYLALAEALAATFLTRDAAVARIPGVDVEVEVVATGA